MKTKTINLFKFSELSDDLKKKVIEKYGDINTDYEWHDYIIDDWEDKLARQGFENAVISYTGFYSQGDGASFSCNVNLEKFLKGRRLATKYAKAIKLAQETGDNIVINQGGHYSHEYTMSIDADNIDESLTELILSEARDQAKKIYKDLYKSYEYLTSEEAIIETIEANDYYFNDKGEIDSE